MCGLAPSGAVPPSRTAVRPQLSRSDWRLGFLESDRHPWPKTGRYVAAAPLGRRIFRRYPAQQRGDKASLPRPANFLDVFFMDMIVFVP